MKRIIILLISCFSVLFAIAQERKEFDFTFTVDEEESKTLCAPLYIYLQKDNGEKTNIEFDYCPGRLSLNIDDYKKIQSFDGKMGLSFGYDSFEDGKIRNYSYDIPLCKQLFECVFVIVKIYNLHKEKYKKLYPPLDDGKNYNYDLLTSKGCYTSMIIENIGK